MSFAVDGPLLHALKRAREMIAATNQWAAIAAENRIYVDALPPADPGPDFTRAQLESLRPFCVLWHDVSGGMSIAVATADRTHPVQSGKIIAQFELNTPAAMIADPNALGEYVQRIAGRLARTGDPDSPGLFDLAAQPNRLPIMRIDIDAYERTDPKEAAELGDAVCFELHLTWGYDR